MLFKRIFLFIIFSTLVIAQGFEGYVKLKIDSEGETMHVKYYKKGEDIRMEPELADVQMSGTMLFTGGSTYVIMPEQKMYMKIDMDKYSDMMPNDGEGEKEDDFKEPVKTGRQEIYSDTQPKSGFLKMMIIHPKSGLPKVLVTL
ncbi:MAG: DUF4412 domain-containing protein [Melioribacteraceae bacterium]|nr:DUF4412 domain-containing protein [Melioribacteraceae bacterium]